MVCEGLTSSAANQGSQTREEKAVGEPKCDRPWESRGRGGAARPLGMPPAWLGPWTGTKCGKLCAGGGCAFELRVEPVPSLQEPQCRGAHRARAAQLGSEKLRLEALGARHKAKEEPHPTQNSSQQPLMPAPISPRVRTPAQPLRSPSGL